MCLHLFLTDGGGICDVDTWATGARQAGRRTSSNITWIRTFKLGQGGSDHGNRELTAESMRAELAIVLAATSANESVLKVRCSWACDARSTVDPECSIIRWMN